MEVKRNPNAASDDEEFSKDEEEEEKSKENNHDRTTDGEPPELIDRIEGGNSGDEKVEKVQIPRKKPVWTGRYIHQKE